jgi:hypothetical protein
MRADELLETLTDDELKKRVDDNFDAAEILDRFCSNNPTMTEQTSTSEHSSGDTMTGMSRVIFAWKLP